jgi:hypothetical protein
MTGDTAPGQAGATPGGPAGRGPGAASAAAQPLPAHGLVLDLARGGEAHPGRPPLPGKAIAGALGVVAFASVVKNNKARSVRRVAHWYMVKSEVQKIEVLHRGRRALKPGKRLRRAP